MAMRSNELLLGFDVREMWLGPQEYWPDSRKKMYLLRYDVVRPLSIDTSVWRAVFDVDTSLQRPQWTGPIQNLWDNLAALQESMDAVWSERTFPCWTIAVTLQEDVCENEDLLEWDARASNIVPSLRDPAWAFLGYDVCDKWLLSGLSNCGYGTNESEIQILRGTYASDLNEHHLFGSIEPATAFRMLSDERVQEHAPFFVFGIWLIKKEESLDHPKREKNDLA